MSRTERRALYIGAGLTVFVLAARLAGFGEGAALRSVDLLFGLRGPVAEDEALTPCFIVAIDSESFDNMPEKWTWPRSFYGKVIRQIMKGKPKVIVFDMTFTEETAGDPRQDNELAAASRQAGCVIMGAELVNVVDKQYQYQALKLPIKVLRNAVWSTGIVNTPLDADAYVRHSSLIWKVHDERHYSLALEALRRYLGVGHGEINTEGGVLEFGDRRIPLDQNGQMLINFAGPAKTFRTIPFYQVYNGSFDASAFKDAVVFVGATAEVLHDTFPTPFSWDLFGDTQVQPMPGVEIHANVVDTIVRNRFITTPPALVVPGLIFGLGLLISLVAIRARIWLALTATLLAAGGVMAASIWLFVSYSMFLEVVHPLSAVGLAFLGCTVYRASVERREQQRVRATFARYVTPHVLNTVLNKPPELGGAHRTVTILFSDVRSFTAMSEKLTAHEVVALLNEYLTEMVDEVLRNDGTLDKFVGDAVMAVYGSPMDQPDHALRAVSTAWGMHLRHEKLKAKWLNEGKTPFEIGIGLNTGEVVAGNMGSPKRMEFTVIGDNVNLASRMESATKECHQKILLSGSTYELVKDHVEVKEFDPIHMKGKSEPIKVYGLLGLKESSAGVFTKLLAAAASAAGKRR